MPPVRFLSFANPAARSCSRARELWDHWCNSGDTPSGDGGTVTTDGLEHIRNAAGYYVEIERRRNAAVS